MKSQIFYHRQTSLMVCLLEYRKLNEHWLASQFYNKDWIWKLQVHQSKIDKMNCAFHQLFYSSRASKLVRYCLLALNIIIHWWTSERITLPLSHISGNDVNEEYLVATLFTSSTSEYSLQSVRSFNSKIFAHYTVPTIRDMTSQISTMDKNSPICVPTESPSTGLTVYPPCPSDDQWIPVSASHLLVKTSTWSATMKTE